MCWVKWIVLWVHKFGWQSLLHKYSYRTSVCVHIFYSYTFNSKAHTLLEH